MAEDLIFTGTKAARYEDAFRAIQGLCSGETDAIANQANAAAVLKQAFDWLWVGFYRVQQQELVLGPFQGPVACTRIAKGKGVCGTAWEKAEIICVPDVDKFPGHIACSSASRSEIVIPLIQNGRVTGILDIDSVRLDDFDETDTMYLKKIGEYLSEIL